MKSGFTLIELSIVLVIIGLIVGGVLVGRDLIAAAQIRAQISQIEKFKTAMNTFRVKYNAMPGDMQAAQAAQVGFNTRTGAPGDGDGDGYITGILCCSLTEAQNFSILGGETVLFWTDLSSAQLIEGSFRDNTDAPVPALTKDLTPYLPKAKAGQNGLIYIFNGLFDYLSNRINSDSYFELMSSPGSSNTSIGYTTSTAGPLSTTEAFSIDTKMDDGMPQTGTVLAARVGLQNGSWALQTIDDVSGTSDPFNGVFCVSSIAGNPYNVAHPDIAVCNLLFRIQ